MHADLEQAALLRLAEQGDAERREVLREDGDDVDEHVRRRRGTAAGSASADEPSAAVGRVVRRVLDEVQQPGRRIDLDPPAGDVHDRHHRLDERHQHLALTGLHDQHVAVRQVQHVDDLAQRLAGDEHGGHAAQDVVVVLVLVLGRRQRAAVDLEQRLAQQLGGVAVLDAGEGDHEPAVLPPRGVDEQRPAVGGVGQQRGAGGEALVRGVGAHLHGDLALDALRLADAPDDQQVLRRRVGPGRGGGRGGRTSARVTRDARHAASGPRRCRRRPRARPCRRSRP